MNSPIKARFIFLSLILILIISQIAKASVPETIKPEIKAVRIEKAINLSGKLDDPLWLKAEPVELKYEVMPAENTPALQKTMIMRIFT
jgi:hypothetical protein